MPQVHVQHGSMREPLTAVSSSDSPTRGGSVASCLNAALAIFVAGVGLMSDSYDFAVINLVRASLATLYPIGGDFSTSPQRSLITASSIFGAMTGQFLLGYLADRLGRRRLLLASGGLTFLGALGSACAFNFGAHNVGVWSMLIAWRFVMGVGIGGEYPLSAAHTAEHSKAGTSGVRLALVFMLFGVGPVLASGVVYLCQVSGASPAFTWRFAFGFGAALSVLSVTLRYNLVQNSEKFERVRRQRNCQASNSPAATASVSTIIRRYWRPLLGTAGSWFLYDIIDYGLALYSDDVLKNLKIGDGDSSTTLAVLVVQLISLPGCCATVFLIKRVGRRGLQLLGVAGMLCVYVTLAIILSLEGDAGASRRPVLMVMLYALQLLFDYMGPGATTYIIPGELFPTAARATCHGLSAGAGKIGAAFGSYAFGTMIDQLGLRGTFVFTSCVSVVLFVWTLLFIPSYDDHTLELLEEADADGQAITLLYRKQRYLEMRELAGNDEQPRTPPLPPTSSAPPPAPPSPPPAKAPCWTLTVHDSSELHGAMPDYRELSRGVSGSVMLVATADTDGFRRLARMQADPNDRIVEIGCSYGGCSAVLCAGRAREQYIGVDNSRECVEHCRRTLPSARFDQLDVLRKADANAGLRSLMRLERPSLIVIDVGGNRALADVLEVVDAIMEAAMEVRKETQPTLVLLKSRALVHEARRQGAVGTLIGCPGTWWHALRQRCRTSKDGGVCDKEAGIGARLHSPMWYPQRAAAVGLPPCCRFHNYDVARGCKRRPQPTAGEVTPPSAALCPFDHDHCHFCLRRGHVAHQCEEFLATLAHSPTAGPNASMPTFTPISPPPPSPPPSPPPPDSTTDADEEAYLSLLATADDETKARRDEALVAYLSAYQDYTTCHVELQAVLKQGHLDLSRARRDLSRSHPGSTALGATLYPREMAAQVTLTSDLEPTDDSEDSEVVRVLSVVEASADASTEKDAPDEAAARAAAPDDSDDAESETLAQLAQWGVSSDLQRQIARAVTDRGDDVGMACGDSLAIEHRDGTSRGASVGASAHNARSAMSFSAGGIDELKHAQFRAALGAADASAARGKDEGGDTTRPKPQSRPSNSRDPIRWFTLLPPPSLRQAQKNFRRATETAVRCANSQARMEVARERYEALLPGRSLGAAAGATTSACE